MCGVTPEQEDLARVEGLAPGVRIHMSRITHFLAEIMNPKNSASKIFLTVSMSDGHLGANKMIQERIITKGYTH